MKRELLCITNILPVLSPLPVDTALNIRCSLLMGLPMLVCAGQQALAKAFLSSVGLVSGVQRREKLLNCLDCQ